MDSSINSWPSSKEWKKTSELDCKICCYYIYREVKTIYIYTDLLLFMICHTNNLFFLHLALPAKSSKCSYLRPQLLPLLGFNFFFFPSLVVSSFSGLLQPNCLTLLPSFSFVCYYDKLRLYFLLDMVYKGFFVFSILLSLSLISYYV